MKEYLDLCASHEAKADKIVIEKDDVVRGLLELISEFSITELVMGAASDRCYSKKMRVPKSKKAISILQQADSSCRISFICKGNLICTREVGGALVRAEPPSASPRSSISEPPRAMSSPQRQCELVLDSLSSIVHSSRDPPLNAGSLPEYDADTSATYNELSNDEGEFNLQSPCAPEEDPHSQLPQSHLDDAMLDDELLQKLNDSLIEAENLRSEEYEESRRRYMAETCFIEASKKAKAMEDLYLKEVRHRKEIEDKLGREKAEIEQDEKLLHDILGEIKKANDQTKALEIRTKDSEEMLVDFERRLSEAHQLIKTLKLKHQEVDEDSSSLKLGKENRGPRCRAELTFTKFDPGELKRATANFNDSFKVRNAPYGIVFKCSLGEREVVVRKFNPHICNGCFDFAQEVEVLSRLRHRNLVSLAGACPGAYALVDEILPSENLEDRLAMKESWPFPWYVRVRIASEICSALVALHSNEPSVIHGDLKPENVLLDTDDTSKLFDFGIQNLLQRPDDTLVNFLHRPRTTLAYMDPSYVATGELTTRCDIYSFGLILLRLLTGRSVFRIKKIVQEALDQGNLEDVLDVSANGWPLKKAKEIALLGLRCCDHLRKKTRLLFAEEVWSMLEPLVSSILWNVDNQECVPSYFMCPILKDIMKDPQIASDGFTYEAAAIREWLDGGHNTSPMTNLKLASADLIPNRALRSAILDWSKGRP